MSDPILKVSKLSKHYSGDSIAGISEIDFELDSGAVLAVIGESGSGKSTLLKTIYGLHTPDEGEVLFEGKKVKGPNEQLVPGHPQMRMVTQDFSLNIYAKVYDNIASMLSNTDVKAKAAKTLEVMEQLHIGHLSDKKIIELSGGEQQRVAIARTLVADIKVLLLDEPFSQVDALLKSEMRADLKRLAVQNNLTIVLVSHDPADGLFLANKVLILKDGKMVQIGRPEDIYNHPTDVYTARLLGNANVMESAAASEINIKATGKVVFYPEWVLLEKSWTSKRYIIEDIYFKGFYEELLLVRNGQSIRAIHTKTGKFKLGDSVQVKLDRFLEL